MLGPATIRTRDFQGEIPFAEIALTDKESSIDVLITGWSSFEPLDEDNSSLPVAGLEHALVNRSRGMIEAVFSFNAPNFMTAAQGRRQRRQPTK